MTTQETTKENKTYVRPTMEIYPVYVENLLGTGDTGHNNTSGDNSNASVDLDHNNSEIEDNA
ncbi:hypothetical protein [Prevotella sp.]